MLLSSGSKGVSTTEYGRQLMLDMMTTYNTDKERYARLSGHGMKILGEAIYANLPYQINCPALLICGKKDRAGSSIRHNKAWHKKTGIPLVWIENAGHNSNTAAPTLVNQLIDDFIKNYN
jgi:pimeloyl-ACP methyl ester carboxylesterase